MTKVSWPSFIGIFLTTIGNGPLVRRTRIYIHKKPGFHLSPPHGRDLTKGVLNIPQILPNEGSITYG
jgi:hypothetical protein